MHEKEWRIINHKGEMFVYYGDMLVNDFVEKIEITMEKKKVKARIFITAQDIDINISENMIELFKRAWPVEKLEGK